MICDIRVTNSRDHVIRNIKGETGDDFSYLQKILNNPYYVDLPEINLQLELQDDLINHHVVMNKLPHKNIISILKKYSGYYQTSYQKRKNLQCYCLYDSDTGNKQLHFYSDCSNFMQVKKFLIITIVNGVQYHYVYTPELNNVLIINQENKVLYKLQNDQVQMISTISGTYKTVYKFNSLKIKEILRYRDMDGEFVLHGISEYFNNIQQRIVTSYYLDGLYIHSIIANTLM